MGIYISIIGPHYTYLIKSQIDIGTKINFLLYKNESKFDNFKIN